MANDMFVNALLIILAVAVLYWLISNYQSKQSAQQAERFYNNTLASELSSSKNGVVELPYNGPLVPQSYKPAVGEANSVLPAEETEVGEFRTVDYDTKKLANDCFPKDRLGPADLLPKDAANSKWSMVAPSGQGDLMDQNFLTSGFHIGVNTQGSSLRNANQQLRSEPPIQKGTWEIMNSTIEPDMYRKPLDVDSW
jgi:hypothetical protein